MFQNDNKVIVKKLTKRSLIANKRRNFFVVAAITLTAIMITSIFSIGMSIFESLRMQQVRLEGSMSHAAFPYPTTEQIASLKSLDYVEIVGTGNYVGIVQNIEQMGDFDLNMVYFDEALFNDFHVPAWTKIVGNYPQKANEIMVSRWTLEKMGIINPEIGMTIPLSFKIVDEDTIYSEVFTLSGYYTSYDYINSEKSGVLLVSDELSKKYCKSIENDGSVNIIFKDSIHVGQYVEKLKTDVELADKQPILQSPVFNINYSEHISTIISLSMMVAFLMFTGYLLIYNVLYISVSRDVRFYGLLKTIGTTPKQIRRILTRQVMQLCIIGIPAGALLAALISCLFVPAVVSGSNIETGVVISFSPVIYIGAAIFTLVTAFAGAIIPAKRAACISAIEAVKYTGEIVKTSHINSFAHAKLYRLALRNIFRDRKRAIIVFLSLFLGVTTFMAVTTVISSIDIDKYAASYIESDFLLQNEALAVRADRTPKFTDDFLKQVQDLTGVKEIQIVTQEWDEIKYTLEVYEPHIEWYLEKSKTYNGVLTKELIESNFTGIIHGIDKEALIEFNKTLIEPIDVDSFERGEFALISTDEPWLYDNVRDMEITCLQSDNTFVIPIGGFVPYSFKQASHSVAPTIFVSNTLLKQRVDAPLVSLVNINISEGFDEQTLKALKEMTDGNYDIYITSRVEARQGMEDAKIILYVLGGGVSIILGLIGILNFINVMSVGIIVRKREFATLESIGMSREQMRRMLLYEGVGYAVITLLLVAIIGNVCTYGIYSLFSQHADYMVFSYPFIPMLVTSLIILAICIATPEMTYRSVNNATIIERLRETE